MMKSFGFLFCVLLMGTWTTAVNTVGYDDKRNIAASNPGFVSLQTDNNIHDISASMITSRKLKDKIDDISSSNYKEDNNSGKINVEDYQPVNPVPSYKASIRPGPVQHGTPLMPYIPNPNSPPPNHGG